MTSKREELIEQAAKAIYEHSETTGEGVTCMGCDERINYDLALHQARAALAVFEQALTPAVAVTDDERATVLAILSDMDYNDGGMMRWSSGVPTQQAEKVADRIMRELRRPVQGEPTDAQVKADAKVYAAWEEHEAGVVTWAECLDNLALDEFDLPATTAGETDAKPSK